MQILGYKIVFKKIKGVEDDVFTINFKLEYNEQGFMYFRDVEDDFFDVGDFRIKIDELVEDFDDEKLKEIDNGVYILSICKYIVDKIPNVYSINYESKGMIDTYYREDIINDYNKIAKYRERFKDK